MAIAPNTVGKTSSIVGAPAPARPPVSPTGVTTGPVSVVKNPFMPHEFSHTPYSIARPRVAKPDGTMATGIGGSTKAFGATTGAGPTGA